VGGGQGKRCQALGQVLLHPGGQFGGRLGIVGDDFLEPPFGGGAAGAVEDAADGGGDFSALLPARDVRLGVLLEMELAALPGDGGEHGGAGGFEAGVIIAGDVGDAAETALDEALEEGAPVGLGLAQGGADAEDGALAVRANPQGDKHGAVEELAVPADLFVAGIQDQIDKGAQGAGAPGVEFGVQEFGALADLGGTDAGAAEVLDDGGDFAGGDALDVHFGQGELEGLFGTEAFFEGGRVELQAAADLRDAEGDGAQAGGEGFGFEAVGMALAGVGALVGLGLEGLGAFLAHGGIDEQADAFGEAGGALLGQELQNGVQEFRLGLVGHWGLALVVFCDTPTRDHSGPPSTSFSRAARPCPSGVRLRSARCARLRSASPRRGKDGGKENKLQKEFYTGHTILFLESTYCSKGLQDGIVCCDYILLSAG